MYRIAKISHDCTVVGIRKVHNFAEMHQTISAHWGQFMPAMHLPSSTDNLDLKKAVQYGISNPGPDGCEYMTAVETSKQDIKQEELPAGWTIAHLPKGTYAVLKHTAHISKIGETCASLTIPAGYKRREVGFSFYERYEDYNPKTGLGNVELWQPIEETQ